MMKNKFYVVFVFCGIWVNYSKVNYVEILRNVNTKNYKNKLNELERNNREDVKYWYCHSCLLKEIIILNLLSNDLNEYIIKLKESVLEVLKFKKKKYNVGIVNVIISLYNLFLERGCEYIKKGCYKDALKSFKIASEFFDEEHLKIKMCFVENLLNKNNKVLEVYSEILENKNKRKTKKNDEESNLVKMNMLGIYLREKNFEKVIELLKEILSKNPCDIQILEFLSGLKDIKEIRLEDLLSKKRKILQFQEACILYFRKDLKEAYEILHGIKGMNIHQMKLFSDVMYNYCIELQNNSDIIQLKNIINENIKICKKIFEKESRNNEVLNRLCVLYVLNHEGRNAKKLANKIGVNIDKLYYKNFSKKVNEE